MTKKRSKKAKQVRKVLRRAQGVITPKSSWTTRTEARDGEGRSVPVDSPQAQRFCAIGSVSFVIASVFGTSFKKSDEGLALFSACLHALDRCARTDDSVGSIVSLNDDGMGDRVRKLREEWLAAHGGGMVPLAQESEFKHQAVLDAFDCAIEEADELFPVEQEETAEAV